MFLLHSHPGFAKKVQRNLEQTWGISVQLITHSNEVLPANPATILGILEPHGISGTYLSTYGLWVDYLKLAPEPFPSIRPIQLGLAPSDGQPNVVDLFGIPTADWLAKSLPAKEISPLPLQKTYHLNGLDIRLHLRQFLRGHGEHLLYEQFEKVRRKLHLVEKLRGEGRRYEDIRRAILIGLTPELVGQFISRWQQYEPYFSLLPPVWQLAPYRSVLADLQAFVRGEQSESQWDTLQLSDRIDPAFSILETLRTLYLS